MFVKKSQKIIWSSNFKGTYLFEECVMDTLFMSMSPDEASGDRVK
jgi:hypothetical protein